jgi:serine/threonine protein kinase
LKLFSDPQGIIAKVGDLADAKSSTFQKDFEGAPAGFGSAMYRDPLIDSFPFYTTYADVYSFGRILSRLLLGEEYFKSRDNEIIRKVKELSLFHRLAWYCVHEDAHRRPKMHQVVQELSKFGLNLFQPAQTHFDFEVPQLKGEKFDLEGHKVVF